MPSRRPFAWAVSAVMALPRLRASSGEKPSRSATTVAHRPSTGARLISIRGSVSGRDASSRVMGLLFPPNRP